MVSIKQTIDSTSKLLSAYLTIYTHIDGRHLCHPSDAFNETAPVNATDLLADARVFCARSGKLLPNMRPGATIMGNGRGISSKQHFKISWVKGCRPENGTSLTPSLVDPQGNGERLGEERDDRCTWLLYQNWKKCRFLSRRYFSFSVWLTRDEQARKKPALGVTNRLDASITGPGLGTQSGRSQPMSQKVPDEQTLMAFVDRLRHYLSTPSVASLLRSVLDHGRRWIGGFYRIFVQFFCRPTTFLLHGPHNVARF